jgi:hypothetical protein
MRPSLPIGLALLSLMSGCDTADHLTVEAFAIQYVVEATGASATVTEVSYTDTSGNLVVEMSPTLPWTMVASREAGDTATLLVTGTTGAGSTITATIQDDPALVASPMTYASEMCAENTDPCDISLVHAF